LPSKADDKVEIVRVILGGIESFGYQKRVGAEEMEIE
jgi:hypothetical protein